MLHHEDCNISPAKWGLGCFTTSKVYLRVRTVSRVRPRFSLGIAARQGCSFSSSIGSTLLLWTHYIVFLWCLSLCVSFCFHISNICFPFFSSSLSFLALLLLFLRVRLLSFPPRWFPDIAPCSLLLRSSLLVCLQRRPPAPPSRLSSPLCSPCPLQSESLGVSVSLLVVVMNQWLWQCR